jgi:hypothetical protein
MGFRRQPALSAIQIRLTLFDRQQRNEKQTEIVIHALPIHFQQTAPGAAPGLLVHGLNSGLDAGNEEHGR